jgi:WD40 repeat protein
LAHFLPRFTTLQLLLAAALCGLILGLVTAAWRTAQYARITAIAFSPSGERLAARYSGGGFQAWKVGDSSPRLVAQTRMEQLFADNWGPVRFADDATLVDIRTVYNPGKPAVEVRTIDLATSRIDRVMSLPHIAWSPPFSAGSGQLAVANWSTMAIECYDVKARRLVRTVPGLVNSPYGLDVTPDGSKLAFFDQASALHVVDFESGQTIRTLPSSGASIAELARDGRLLALSDHAGPPIALHDLTTTNPPRLLDHRVSMPAWMSFTADGSRLAVGGSDCVEIYDLATYRRVSRIPLDEPIGSYLLGWQQLSLSPDGSQLACFHGGQITLLDAQSGKVQHTITGGRRILQIVIFALGFAVWSIAWGIVSRRATNSPEPFSVPLELKFCWGLLLIGGLVAIVAPVTYLMMSGPLVWPPVYFSLLVGVIAMAGAARRETARLSRLTSLQMCNLLACDPVNFVLGLVGQALLRRPHVRQFLAHKSPEADATTPPPQTYRLVPNRQS